jgi:hypothetical protein
MRLKRWKVSGKTLFTKDQAQQYAYAKRQNPEYFWTEAAAFRAVGFYVTRCNMPAIYTVTRVSK